MSRQNERSSILGFVLFLSAHVLYYQLPQLSSMATISQRPKGRDGALSVLNAAIEALNLAKEISSITPAKAVFGSVSVLLAMIRARFFPFRVDELLIYVYPGLDGQ
jgi:hypothetical protein